jgi:hypothetical protein
VKLNAIVILASLVFVSIYPVAIYGYPPPSYFVGSYEVYFNLGLNNQEIDIKPIANIIEVPIKKINNIVTKKLEDNKLIIIYKNDEAGKIRISELNNPDISDQNNESILENYLIGQKAKDNNISYSQIRIMGCNGTSASAIKEKDGRNLAANVTIFWMDGEKNRDIKLKCIIYSELGPDVTKSLIESFKTWRRP